MKKKYKKPMLVSTFNANGAVPALAAMAAGALATAAVKAMFDDDEFNQVPSLQSVEKVTL